MIIINLSHIRCFSWWRNTVVRTSVYDRRTFPGLRHDVQLTGDLLGVNCPLYVSQHGQLSHSSSWVDKWVVSWIQAFAICICVVAPPGECLWCCLQVTLCDPHNERVRGVCEDKLYKSTLPLPLPLPLTCKNAMHTGERVSSKRTQKNMVDKCLK